MTPRAFENRTIAPKPDSLSPSPLPKGRGQGEGLLVNDRFYVDSEFSNRAPAPSCVWRGRSYSVRCNMSREYVLEPFRAPVNLQIDYERELNAQQLAAVTAPPGPCLVIAGAGSGKTRTLTYRVAWLLEQGIPAERILLLTFTNKAAREMMRRVSDLLGSDLPSLWGGTFHSIGNRILRQHANKLGYERDFTILDSEDARDYVSACIGDSGIDAKALLFPKPEVLGEIISFATNTRSTVADIVQREHNEFDHLIPQIEQIQKRYLEKKRAGNAMDFDDLLALWLRLLQDDQDVREHYQRRFQFILVDEYQDTNRLQSDLIDLLADRSKNVMVVGDDAQSIYAWRGANFLNILKFPERYPGAKVYKIETNYRSTPEILALANAAIMPNVHQFTKELAPARKSGIKPVLSACHDAGQQAAFVAQRVTELHEEGTNLNSMAVLYRSHFHALELQLELTRRHIPFTITSGIRYFEQAHLKDVIAWLKFAQNPRDELAFKRLAQMMPGVGAKGADKLWKAFAAKLAEQMSKPSSVLESTTDGESPASSNGEPGEAVLPTAAGSATEGQETNTQKTDTAKPLIATTLQGAAGAVPKKAAVAWAQFVATMSQLEAKNVYGNASKMIRLVVEAGYEDYLKLTYENHERRLDDLRQLAIFAGSFASLEEFLTQLALLTNIEAEEDRPTTTDEDCLRLSTIHQAKGLEFDVVFIIMLCDGFFPLSRVVEIPDGEEEERRLFYVAITRARNELYLSYPLMRAGYGGGETRQTESRFVRDLPRELLEEWNLRQYW
jgi:DNA helicase-2/ATP-dependent DNA helicase PcrA